jgi:hypothetical protein
MLPEHRVLDDPSPVAAAAVAPSPSAGFSIAAPCAGQAAGNSDRASRRTRDHRAELKRERSVLRLPASPCTPPRIFVSLAFLVACVTPALSGTTAQRAKSFTDSVGIGYPNNVGYAAAYAVLSTMGITLVRASVPIPGESGIDFNNNYLAAHGIRFNFRWVDGFSNFPFTNCANIATTVAGIISLEDTFVTTYPGAMLTNEGMNETNNFPVCYTNSAPTNAPTPTGSAVLNFATVPPDLVTAANAAYNDGGTIIVGSGFTVTDTTNPTAIPTNTTITAATSTTVTMSANATGAGVLSGDTIQFQAQGVEPSSNVNVTASSLGWQAAIYNATHADQTLTGAGVKVANYTGYIYGATPNPPSVVGTAGYNNLHFYPTSGQQPTAYTRESMIAALNPANQPIPGLPTVVTEAGWCTGTGTAGLVDQTTQAIFLLNDYFDMFLAKVPYTTAYTMFDYNTGDNNCYDNYGVYESDQVTPKISGTAIKNMQTVLGDSSSAASTFTPGTLNYSIVGLPSSGFDFLLQKANGTWEIVVWNEPQIWDDTTHAEITPPITNVTVNLGSVFTAVNVYDPVNGVTPISMSSNVNSVTLAVGAHPLIVEAKETSLSCSLPSTHDFNGDCKSDILWRDDAGNVGMWLMNGSAISQASVLGDVPSNWSIVGQRDFNGDGYADILWRDSVGDVAIWLMNGFSVTSATVLGNVSPLWSVVGTGDFNGDGKSDILWRDNVGNVGIWFMNGTTITQTAIVGNMPIVWVISGSDMKGDIFWRNTTTGEVGMWVMNGTVVAQTVNFGVVPLDWTIAGIGDFDRNGSTDILWRDTSGNVGMWLMSGTNILSGTVLGNVPLTWTIAETGDYSGAGTSDILWRDNLGDVAIWFMNGATVSSVSNYGNVGTTWTLQALNAD